MLLNTVVISLSNILPICIFLVLIILLCNNAKVAANWICLGLLLGIFLNLVLINTASYLGTWFEYKGMEYFLIMLHSSFYLSIIFLLLRFNHQDDIWLILLILSSCFSTLIYGNHFLIYILGYWQQSFAVNALIIGSTLGLGVCISFSILFYFSVNYLIKKFTITILFFFLLLHASGQLLPALNLAVQVDLITQHAVFWDSSGLVSESSELGRLLKALFGYEAKPSLLEIFIFVISTFLPLAYFIFTKGNITHNSSNLTKDSK